MTDNKSINVEVLGIPANGKIIAWRVQNLTKGIWFNQDNDTWDENGQPQGVTNDQFELYCVVENIGDTGGITIVLTEGGTGGSTLIKSTSISIASGSTGYIWEQNWTKSVAGNYQINCAVTP